MPSAQTTSFSLSAFNPDHTHHAIEEWLEVATKLKEELNVVDVLMIAKAGEALKGRAHNYYCEWRPLQRTWAAFCADLIIAFPDRETPGARAFKAATLRSRDCTTLSEYGIQKLRSIQRFYSNLPWDTTLSMVEYGLDHPEAKISLQIQQPRGDRDLLKLLSDFDARRQILKTSQNAKPVDFPRIINASQMHGNRPAFRSNQQRGMCFRCGRVGHRQHQCETLSKSRVPRTCAGDSAKDNPTSAVPQVQCSHCKRPGHTFKNCWYLLNNNPKKL